MSEIIKRVAQAIQSERYGMASDLDLARAAIEAMREPTEGMVEAVFASFNGEHATHFDFYQAMIDDALKP